MTFAGKALVDNAEYSQYGGNNGFSDFKINTLSKEYPGLCKYVYYTMSMKAYGLLENIQTREIALAAFRERRRTDAEFSRQLKKEEFEFADGDFEAVDDLPLNILQQFSLTPSQRGILKASMEMTEEERRELYEQRAADARLLSESGKSKKPRE